MTYGEHQEAAAAALRQLLTPVEDRDEDEHVGTTLACRRQIHLALHDRLFELGIDRHLERDPRFSATILPIGDGLLVAAYRGR
jgi:hypothetical protein